MSSQAATARASVAERRASAAVRRGNRPTSASVTSPGEDLRGNSRSPSTYQQQHRKSQSSAPAYGTTQSVGSIKNPARTISSTTTTTTETKRDTFTRETLLKRTSVVPVKRPEAPSQDHNSRRSADGDRTVSQEKISARRAAENPPASPPSWNPRATLLTPTTAPLASRISIPPLAAHAPTSLQPTPLGALSLDEQEKAILEDLLFVLMGFEGQYLRFASSYNPLDEKSKLLGPQFVIQPGLDPSLRDLTHGTMKMATHYSAIEAFVDVQSREEMGTVNHALCASIRKLLKDYLILVAQLEHQMLSSPGFTLHQLSLYAKPTGHLMAQIYTVAHEILKENSMLASEEEDDMDKSDDFENILESLREGKDAALPGKKVCKGGSVLRLLTRRLASMAGDPAARQLLSTLLKEASRPYMAMLNEWLHHGNVRDPHSEFLIKEQKSIRREGLEQDYTDEYWEKRYTLRPELVPPQLEAVQEKVLLAGKYLNVVRECGGIDDAPSSTKNTQSVPQTFDDARFLENVSGAYTSANARLLTLLLTTHALPSRLRSLKHYFFLDRSDFFSYFLELTHSELKKPSKNVNVGKLQSLLDLVLRQPGSVASEDPFKEDVKVVMNNVGLTEWLMRVVNVQGMDADATSLSTLQHHDDNNSSTSKDSGKEITGYEALTLDYAVPFPLSLVVSRVTLTRYQLLFRYLLSLRHLESLLLNSWSEHAKGTAWRHKSRGGMNKTNGDVKLARKIEEWKRRVWCLRGRMLCFVQQLLYYCTSEVIEPNWRGFMGRVEEAASPQDEMQQNHNQNPGDDVVMETAKDSDRISSAIPIQSGQEQKVKRTVDELMQDHVDFLATCLKECMLTNSKLLRINAKVMNTCTFFANYTSSLSRILLSADPDLAASGPTSPTTTNSRPAPTYDPSKLDKLFNILQQYEEHFGRHLKILLDALNYLAATETAVFLNLCARLQLANEGGSYGGGPPIGAAYG